MLTKSFTASLQWVNDIISKTNLIFNMRAITLTCHIGVMMKSGTKFEKLTERIFSQLVENPEHEKVEHNVMLEGKDGQRQIDILITYKIAGMSIKTIVECKDYSSKVCIGVVDALHSVMQDVNANKGVLVSSNGFSSSAINKAKRLGISLFTAHEALSEKWKLDIEIPILVTEISSFNAYPEFDIYLDPGTEIHKEATLNINDVDVASALIQDLKTSPQEDLLDFKNLGNGYCPSSIKAPFYIRDTLGNKRSIENFRITFEIKKEYYFGYLNEQSDVVALRDAIDSGLQVVFKPDFIFDYKNKLRKINQNEIPSVGEIKIECISEPKFYNFSVDSITLSTAG